MLMKKFLRSKEYWSLVETGIPAAAEAVEITEAQQQTIADQKLKDLKVKNYLFQAIDRTIMKTNLNRDTAKKKKKKLRLYEGEVPGFHRSQKSSTPSS